MNWMKWILVVLAGLFFLGLLGCQGAGTDGKLMVGDYLDVLQAGNADGHLTLTAGGSPVQAGMKQVFFLGPENCSMSFDGSIDFGSVGAADLVPVAPEPEPE